MSSAKTLKTAVSELENAISLSSVAVKIRDSTPIKPLSYETVTKLPSKLILRFELPETEYTISSSSKVSV